MTSLISSVCRTYGLNNFSLHHSVDLMSSPIGYIFLKPLDKCVVIIINILTPSKISIEFMMRNTILALDEFYYHRPLYCLPTNTSLFVFGVIPSVPCYPAIGFLYLGTLPSIMSSMFWEFHHLLRIRDTVMLLAITILYLVPVLSELHCANLISPATLLLQSYWIMIPIWCVGCPIAIPTLVVQPNPYFGCTFQPMFNYVWFPPAYIIKSFDLTNVISLFT